MRRILNLLVNELNSMAGNIRYRMSTEADATGIKAFHSATGLEIRMGELKGLIRRSESAVALDQSGNIVGHFSGKKRGSSIIAEFVAAKEGAGEDSNAIIHGLFKTLING